jgi:uncharacterized protein YcbX
MEWQTLMSCLLLALGSVVVWAYLRGAFTPVHAAAQCSTPEDCSAVRKPIKTLEEQQAMASSAHRLVVEQLWVYPVKGCGGIAVSSALLLPTGVSWDRHFMVVAAYTGQFISQRQHPRLCLVGTALPNGVTAARPTDVAAGTLLTLTAPKMPPLEVPLALSPSPSPSALKKVTCWYWTGTALDCGDPAAAWFSLFLDTPARLVRHIGAAPHPPFPVPEDAARPADPYWRFPSPLTFTDQQPLLIATSASLAALNATLPHSDPPLPMNRFRPNVVIGGAAAWEEDGWAELAVGDTDLKIVKPCSRCRVPTVDQITGLKGNQPLTALGEVRKGSLLGPDWQVPKMFKHMVFFGVQAAPVVAPDRDQGGTVRVGQAVVVVGQREGAWVEVGGRAEGEGPWNSLGGAVEHRPAL